MRTDKLLKIAEMRQNLWRCYRDGGREVKIPPKQDPSWKNNWSQDQDSYRLPGGPEKDQTKC